MTDKSDLELLREEVEILKKGGDEFWLRKPSNVISILALLFSFGTTIFSAYNSHLEDIRANRREVRALLERLSKIPIENYEFLQRNKDSGQGQALSGMINQENILLATQAAELIDRYPASFTSTEYYAVAYALSASNINGKVPSLFQRAIEAATTSNDYNVAARVYGGYLYSKGEYTEGRRLFADSLNAWSKFPERNAYVVNSTDLLTYMYWGQAEFAAGNRQEAKDKLSEARKKLSMLPGGPMTESLRSQIEYTAKFIEQ
jgi:hypothetical protein